MKASKQVQENIFELGQIDLELSRTKRRVVDLQNGAIDPVLQSELLQVAQQVGEARHRVETLELDKTRAEGDLSSVEQRIARDEALLSQTTSSKDAQGIQSEIASLKKRRSDLEDAELAILEDLEQANASLTELQKTKAALDERSAAHAATVATELTKLQSSLALLADKRKQAAERIPDEVLAAYAKKAERGNPVGRLGGRECGACRMSLTVGDFDHVATLAEDDFATCPECQAFLVRN